MSKLTDSYELFNRISIFFFRFPKSEKAALYLFVFFTLSFFSSTAFAETTITLKNGKKFVGTVVGEDNNFFILKRNGINVRILKQIVLDVNGKLYVTGKKNITAVKEKTTKSPSKTKPSEKKTTVADGRNKTVQIITKKGKRLNGKLLFESNTFIAVDDGLSISKIMKDHILDIKT